MKKFLLSAFVLGSFGLYVISQKMADNSGNFTVPTTNVSTPQIAIKPTPSPIPMPVPPSVVIPPKRGMYADGTYTGNSADAYYGYIQVKAVINNGELSDIVFLDYPQDRGTSIRINTQAMPILKSEAIKAQRANVDGISGATDSSGAFVESLGNALAQAKA